VRVPRRRLRLRLPLLYRARVSTATFGKLLEGRDRKVVRLPASSANLNTHGERILVSVESECLNHVVPLCEAHLLHALRESGT
jgi:hypothetical protein